MTVRRTVGPAQRRQLAQWIVKAKAFSQQRACRLAGLSRRMFAYQSKRPPDTEVEQVIQTVARRHPGWGFWRPPRGRFDTGYVGKATLIIIRDFADAARARLSPIRLKSTQAKA